MLDGPYITDLFQESSCPDPVIAEGLENYSLHLNDFLLKCVKDRMDVCMVTDVLLSKSYEDVLRRITGHSISELLEQIIQGDAEVKVMIAVEGSKILSMLSPSLRELMSFRKKQTKPIGRLNIRGMEIPDDIVLPFYTVGSSQDRSNWILRMEAVNRYNGSTNKLNLENITFTSHTYRLQNWKNHKQARELKTGFDKLFHQK